MSMVRYSLGSKRIRRLIWLVLTIFVLWGYSLQNVTGSVQYSLLLQPNTTVTTPPVILQNGTAGTSTIYTNNTSAKVNVAAPVSTYDFVDNNTSDVDSSADKGTHSNFTAQQYGPDSIYDTLTEEDIDGEESLAVYCNSYGSVSGGVTNPTYIYGSPDLQYAECGKNEDIYSNGYDTGSETITQVYFNVTYYGTPTGAGVIAWRYQLDDSGFVDIKTLATGGSAESPLTDTYNATSLRASWSWADINNTDIQIEANGGAAPYTIYVDAIYMTVVIQITNYELDLEVQWTTADYDETNEYLCIYAGVMDAEDLKVDVRNTTANCWDNLFTNLTANSWNNISVSDYLTSVTFTIRFKGGTETGDANQDSWNIDTTLLHVWTDQSYDYVLEVNNTVAQAWNIRLKAYDQTNIERLQNCTIYFHNGSGISRQIYIHNGAYDQQVGDWYGLAASSSDYIAITLSATSTGTSYVYVYLEILIPDTSTYSQYVITFEIT